MKECSGELIVMVWTGKNCETCNSADLERFERKSRFPFHKKPVTWIRCKTCGSEWPLEALEYHVWKIPTDLFE